MNTSELKFKEWLDKNKIPYWYIDQSLDSFSISLKEYMIKRPDFMILLPNFGLIFVDVKNKEQAEKYDKFFLFANEVDNYLSLQRTFNIPTWFWIPVSDVTRSGFVFNAKDDKGKFYSVPVDSFVQVSDNDNLERIFTKLFRY